MIVRNSPHYQVFNATGVEYKGSFFFKIFIKYGQLFDLMKILQLLEKKNYLNFNFKKFIRYLLKFCFLNFKLREQKDYFILFCQKYWIYLLENFFDRNNIYFFLFKILNKKKYSIKPLYLDYFGKSKREFLNNICISFIYKKERFFFKKNRYLNTNEKIPRKTIYRYYKNRHNRSIFVNAEAFGSFIGSITPFGVNEISIIASTGLKSDVEMDEIYFLDHQANDYKFPNFAVGSDQNAIFKVKNFKNKIYTKFKRKIRHIFYYNIHHFLGLQRFCSESLFSFFMPQELKRIKYEFVFNERGIPFSIKLKIYRKLNSRFNLKKKYFGYYFKKIKITCLSFFMLKSLLKLYLYLKKRGCKLFLYIFHFYKSISFIPKIEVVFYKLLKRFQQTTSLPTILLKKKKVFFFNKNQTFFYKNIFQNKMYIQTLIKQVSFSKYPNYFFRFFLIRQKHYHITLLIKEEKDEREPKFNLINSYKNLIKLKPYGFETYKMVYWNFYFFFDLLFNLKLVLFQKTNFNKYLLELLEILEEISLPFIKLQEKWDSKAFLKLKESGEFLREFFIDILLNTYVYFYIHFQKYRKTPLNFLISNLYIYIEKCNYKKKKKDFKIRSNLLNGSSFFLSKWFYYRQINKLTDECSFNSNYLLEKPPENLNLSYKESYFYNLNKINSLGTLTLTKLNQILNRTKKINFKSLFNLRKKRYKSKLKYCVKKHQSGKWTAEENMEKRPNIKYFFQARKLNDKEFFDNIVKYRHFIWARKFSTKHNLLETGFNYKLPSIFRRRKKFWLNRKQVKKDNLVSARIKWKFFCNSFLDYYKNNFEIKEESHGELIYSTFFCIFNYKNDKNIYAELPFWFVK